jgi:hypothetical protein
MEERKQTAVQWLVYQLNLSSDGWMGDLISQAKHMEKKQIIEAAQWMTPSYADAEQYYNETFKSK